VSITFGIPSRSVVALNGAGSLSGAFKTGPGLWTANF